VGMPTAARVDRFTTASEGSAQAISTVGLKRPIAAASSLGHRIEPVGTINLLVVVDVSLTDAGLINAVQTAVEARTQALASARVSALNFDGFATGTATDSVCVACPPGEAVQYCGPATPHGGDVAQAVYRAVLAGAIAHREGSTADAAG
jgi:adenosylcobinamide hydrolase